ncbi:MAG: leucine-rich repeat domain-containing protein [Promethearchaeota archaeon]|jgi:Leucine-rich repeat (LRR) protein
MKISEFVINTLLTLRLEEGKTYIYVAGKRFRQCKFLILNILKEKAGDHDEINSIDEAAELLNPAMKHPPEWEEIHRQEVPVYKILPEEEFWGLCSNLQTWYEHGYNTRLLHANLAFPLLKKLTDLGDLQAKRIFKEEIIERYNTGVESVRHYLRNMNYLRYLSLEELLSIINNDLEREAILQLTEKLFRKDTLDIDVKKGKVIKIRLQGQKMKKVQEQVRELISLEHLILSYNSLEELPEWIGEFQNLMVLEVTDNILKKLPDSIGELKLLKRLNVRNNQIEVLPESIGRLKSLIVLELYQNKIESLPESIGNLTSLELLSIYENKLNNLPESIGKLARLEKLILSNNGLKKIPESFISLNVLKELYLGSNDLKDLPSVIGKLKNLEKLSISNNPITKIPESLYSSEKLRALYIGNTHLKEHLIIKEDFKSKVLTVYYY